MSHRPRIQNPVCTYEAIPVRLSRHANTHSLGVLTYAQRLQEEERRRIEADEAERQRKAQVMQARAELDARLRAASAQRAKDKAAQIIARKEAKAKRQRDIAEAMREADNAFLNGLDEALFESFFREAYARIAARP